MAEIYEDRLLDYFPKIFANLNKKLKDSDTVIQ